MLYISTIVLYLRITLLLWRAGNYSMELNAYRELSNILCDIKDEEVMSNLLEDLCTPIEIESFKVRLTVVYYLHKGFSYREINTACGASLVTISRVAHSLKYGAGGYKEIYKNIVTEK